MRYHDEISIQARDDIGLRPFGRTDAPDLVTGLNDWQVIRWLAKVPHPYRLDHATAYLARAEHQNVDVALSDVTASCSLAICHQDHVIGAVGLVPSTRRTGFRELGFWLSRSFWGQGIMPEAVRAVMQRARKRGQTPLFVAGANQDNVRSQRLIRSLGFIEDGHDDIFSTPLQRRVRIICYREF